MPLLSVRVSEVELGRLRREAAVRGLSLSALVRLKLAEEETDRLDDFERRLSQLEELARGG